MGTECESVRVTSLDRQWRVIEHFNTAALLAVSPALETKAKRTKCGTEERPYILRRRHGTWRRLRGFAMGIFRLSKRIRIMKYFCLQLNRVFTESMNFYFYFSVKKFIVSSRRKSLEAPRNPFETERLCHGA